MKTFNNEKRPFERWHMFQLKQAQIQARIQKTYDLQLQRTKPQNKKVETLNSEL